MEQSEMAIKSLGEITTNGATYAHRKWAEGYLLILALRGNSFAKKAVDEMICRLREVGDVSGVEEQEELADSIYAIVRPQTKDELEETRQHAIEELRKLAADLPENDRLKKKIEKMLQAPETKD